MKKKCFKCKKVKPIEQFYAHSQMADGHLNKCKACAKKDVNSRYQNPLVRPRILDYEKRRNQTPERKAAKKAYEAKVRAESPGRIKARHAVANAVRDRRLKRLPCSICGDPKSEAHHSDYRRPLHVIWLCFKHHREAHGQTVG